MHLRRIALVLFFVFLFDFLAFLVETLDFFVALLDAFFFFAPPTEAKRWVGKFVALCATSIMSYMDIFLGHMTLYDQVGQIGYVFS